MEPLALDQCYLSSTTDGRRRSWMLFSRRRVWYSEGIVLGNLPTVRAIPWLELAEPVRRPGMLKEQFVIVGNRDGPPSETEVVWICGEGGRLTAQSSGPCRLGVLPFVRENLDQIVDELKVAFGSATLLER